MPGQAGDWVKGTPEYIAPARIYMLVAMLGGYISAAALYFAAIPAVKHDIAKREAVVRAGGSPQVCANCDFLAAMLSTAVLRFLHSSRHAALFIKEHLVHLLSEDFSFFGADHTATVAQNHLHCWDRPPVDGDSSFDLDLSLLFV